MLSEDLINNHPEICEIASKALNQTGVQGVTELEGVMTMLSAQKTAYEAGMDARALGSC